MIAFGLTTGVLRYVMDWYTGREANLAEKGREQRLVEMINDINRDASLHILILNPLIVSCIVFYCKPWTSTARIGWPN